MGPRAFSGDDIAARARQRLSLDRPAASLDGIAAPGGDHVLDGDTIVAPSRPHKAASVLVPIVDHPEEATVLLTRRVQTLRAHAGQIAFPGGRIDPGDASPAAAAQREASEEIGLQADHIKLLGYLDPYLTGTGYLVIPTLALVGPGFEVVLNPAEVDEAFEVPLRFLMNPVNHRLENRSIGGHSRKFYAMPFGDRYIWGATAGMLRNLFERLYR